MSAASKQKIYLKKWLQPDQREYLETLKNLEACGVRITTRNCQLTHSAWENLFMLSEKSEDGPDRSIMSDIIFDERGFITEIRLDIVANR